MQTPMSVFVFALGGYMKNINEQGKIVTSDNLDTLSPAKLREIIYNALNSNQYVFSWEESTHQPYSGVFFDGEKEIHLYIYVWNITPTYINNNPHQKGIQIRNSVNNKGFIRPISDTQKTLLLGIYNCPKQPIIAAWDSWYYRNHGQTTCYVDISELRNGLIDTIYECEHGCKVYTMTEDNLPVYASQLTQGNITSLVSNSGQVSKSSFARERTNTKERYIANIHRIKSKIEGLSETEKEAVIQQRVGQGYFKELLLNKYNCKCALCAIKTAKMLKASHIKAWSKSTDKQKLDENNGLLLCAHHDALFDKYLLSFEDDGKPIISGLIPEEHYESLRIDEIPYIDVLEKMKPYLRWHRQELKKREQNNND